MIISQRLDAGLTDLDREDIADAYLKQLEARSVRDYTSPEHQSAYAYGWLKGEIKGLCRDVPGVAEYLRATLK
jgi:hypothetical protein